MTYDDANRGTVQFKGRAKQLLVFDGMRFDSISPTDIDGLIEYRGMAYIVYEVKLQDADMSRGQELALTRIVDDFQKAGKEAALFVCEHSVSNPRKDVLLAETTVRRIYYKGKTYYPSMNAKQATERFISFVEQKNAPSTGIDGAARRASRKEK